MTSQTVEFISGVAMDDQNLLYMQFRNCIKGFDRFGLPLTCCLIRDEFAKVFFSIICLQLSLGWILQLSLFF